MTEPVAAPTELRLRVMTWNLHGGKGVDQKPNLPAMVEVIREADPDLAAFQELFCLPLRNHPATLRRALARPVTFFPSLGLVGKGYGCGLLSRTRPLSVRTQPLLSQGEPRALGEARLEIQGRHLRFLVTHLGLDHDERKRQAEEIAEVICCEDVPTILAGDFNAFLDADELTPLSRAGLITWPQGPPLTFPSPAPTVALDHLFLTPHFQVERCWTLPTTASDHRPLLADLLLPANA